MAITGHGTGKLSGWRACLALWHPLGNKTTGRREKVRRREQQARAPLHQIRLGFVDWRKTRDFFGGSLQVGNFLLGLRSDACHAMPCHAMPARFGSWVGCRGSPNDELQGARARARAMAMMTIPSTAWICLVRRTVLKQFADLQTDLEES